MIKRRNRKNFWISVLNSLKKEKRHSKRNKFTLRFKNIFSYFKFEQKVSKNYIFVWIIFLIIFSMLFVFYWPIFKVKSIEISRNDFITDNNIAYNAIKNVREKSIFFVKPDEIKKSIINYQKNINEIDIDIVMPSKLKINIWSYRWIFNVSLKNTNYILTENWVLVPIKKSSEIRDINIVYDKLKSIPILDYKELFKKEYINKIEKLVNWIEENVINVNIDEITYYKNERELHIRNQNNTLLIYDLESDINKQIEKTVVFDQEHYSLKKEWIIYIDFRINDKLFYCTNEYRWICKSNLERLYWN